MKIITSVVNNTDFIEIQYYTLKKYFQGNYEFIVFNDAKEFPDNTNGNDITIKNKITELCNNLNIKCINIPNDYHINLNMSQRHAETFNKHILTYQINNPDQYLLIDSDLFLVDYFDINRYSKYNCSIVFQSRPEIYYFWPGLCYLDFTKISDINLLDWSIYDKGDTGSMMNSWFLKQIINSEIPTTEEIRWSNKIFHTKNIYFIKHLWSGTWCLNELPENIKKQEKLVDFIKNDTRNFNDKFFCEIYDDIFLHYRAASNWNNEGFDFHKKNSELLKKILLEN